MLTKDLLPFQDPAVDRFLQRGNLLCAMDMGLGKTVVGIACAEELLGEEKIDTCLVVGPAALKFQWAQALAQFTDLPVHKIRLKGQQVTVPRPPYCVVINGTPEQRELQYQRITSDTDYVIMGYDNVSDDMEHVRKLRPQFTILDEATNIKGPAARRSKDIKRVLNSRYRLALTGTPIENRPEECFHIMEWVDKDIFGEFEYFERTYFERDGNGVVIEWKNIPLFHELLGKAMYRKKHEDPDVAPYMPEIRTGTWHVSMAPGTARAYQKVGLDLLDALNATRGRGRFDMWAHYSGEGNDSAVGIVMARHMALEMLLDHPDLLVHSAELYEDSTERRAKGEKKKSWPGSAYAFEQWSDGLVDLLTESAKLAVTVSKVGEILAADDTSKVLIYTAYREMLPILEAAFAGRKCVQYHGGMTPGAKAAAIEKFTRHPGIRIFLSSHAGAYGCDMWMANHLVNYDLPWSAGKADQINARHMRASNEHEVIYVHNLITRRTIEERKLAMLEHKRRIARAIVDGVGASKSGRVANDLQTLTKWLKADLGMVA